MGCMMRCACLLVIVSLQQRPAPNGSVRGVVSCLGLVGLDGVVLYGFECVAFRLGGGLVGCGGLKFLHHRKDEQS